MNISKPEQRVLHALAQGRRIEHVRNAAGRIEQVDRLTRDGWRLPACDLALFAKLKKQRLIASHEGAPYRITREGLAAVPAQANQR